MVTTMVMNGHHMLCEVRGNVLHDANGF